MGVVFRPGQILGRGDLDIFLTNSSNVSANAYSITFALYYVDPSTETEVLVGPDSWTPVNPAVGEYYAAIQVPPNASPGDYRIRWTFKQFASSPDSQVVQEFGVVTETQTSTSGLNSYEQELVDRLRVLLRDNNPDRNYHFRPPEHEGTVGAYNRVFGYVWEDDELAEYLRTALDWWNMMPPETENLSTIAKLTQMKKVWRTPVMWGAMVHALMALSINWVHDEFDYSIGGISLSLEKSSKYESLKQNAEQQFQQAAEAKARTTKFMRGLQQPRFGIGVRSAFGPHVGSGIMSPRRFV